MSRRFTPFAAIAAAVMSSQSGPLVPPAVTSGRYRRRYGGGTGTYRNGDAQKKRDLIAAARAYGWSYRKAKRFARKLDRERAGGAS